MTHFEWLVLALLLVAAVIYRAKIGELVVSQDGKLSHTRLWSNVAYLVGTWMFIRANLSAPPDVNLWMVYLGVIGGHTAISKLITVNAKSKAAGDAAS